MSVKVKICGLTRLGDALAALEAGAAYLGFVLHPASPRHIAPEALRELVRQLPPEAETVGVTVDLTPARNRELQQFCGFKIIQLHGAEPPEILNELAGLRVWKALHLRTAGDLAQLERWRACEMVVADAARGGSGENCDWGLARQAAAMRPLALAGGLRPDNVLEALRQTRPAAVDCASGVESAPGIKDHAAMAALIKEARKYE